MDDLEVIAKMAGARYQHLSRALSGFNNILMRLAPELIEQKPAARRLVKTAILALVGLTIAVSSASADDHRREKREHHNYILERQEAGQVSGVPTTRRIIGRREIDIYRDGSMFEKNNYVGRAK